MALAVQIDLVALFGGVTTGAEQTATGNNMLPSYGFPNPPNPTGVLANLLANAPSSVLGGLTNGTSQTAATFYGEVLETRCEGWPWSCGSVMSVAAETLAPTGA